VEFLTCELKHKLHIVPENGQNLRPNLSSEMNINSVVQHVGVKFYIKKLLRL